MTFLPDPVWPVVVLAFIQAIDGALCIKPAGFIAECFADVRWPEKYWWMMPPIKFAATLGLLTGIWVPYLGAVTCTALILYYATAITMHVRARDFGRNLFLNATIMLLICIATGLFCFVI